MVTCPFSSVRLSRLNSTSSLPPALSDRYRLDSVACGWLRRMSTDTGTSAMSNFDESQSDRLARKARDAPFMIVGLCGLVGLVGYGIYGFKRRTVKTSVYLIQMRVAAQGFVVTSLTAGVAYNLYNKFVHPKLYPASIEAGEEKKE